MADRFLSDRELATFIGVTTRTVRRYRASGRLPTCGLGRARGCLESELLLALGVAPDNADAVDHADQALLHNQDDPHS
jgi:hypothetical protein